MSNKMIVAIALSSLFGYAGFSFGMKLPAAHAESAIFYDDIALRRCFPTESSYPTHENYFKALLSMVDLKTVKNHTGAVQFFWKGGRSASFSSDELKSIQKSDQSKACQLIIQENPPRANFKVLGGGENIDLADFNRKLFYEIVERFHIPYYSESRIGRDGQQIQTSHPITTPRTFHVLLKIGEAYTAYKINSVAIAIPNQPKDKGIEGVDYGYEKCSIDLDQDMVCCGLDPHNLYFDDTIRNQIRTLCQTCDQFIVSVKKGDQVIAMRIIGGQEGSRGYKLNKPENGFKVIEVSADEPVKDLPKKESSRFRAVGCVAFVGMLALLACYYRNECMKHPFFQKHLSQFFVLT